MDYYHCIQAETSGGPEVLKTVQRELRQPEKGEARIRFLAGAVCGPDISMRSGDGLWSGTVLGQKFPCVPGYSMIGEVDAVGAGVTAVKPGDRVAVLTVTGSWTEYLYWRADRLIPVPREIDPVKAAPVILNYIVAYQVLHRNTDAKPEASALIIGGGGGVGSALIQLCHLAGIHAYALSSKKDFTASLGAVPVDYREVEHWEELKQLVLGGFDYIFAGQIDEEYLEKGRRMLNGKGVFVEFAEPPGRRFLWRMLGKISFWNLWSFLPFRPRFRLYGTSAYFLHGQKSFNEDWAKLFSLVKAGSINPPVHKVFPLLDAAEANRLLESGSVCGNVVLAAPEILKNRTY